MRPNPLAHQHRLAMAGDIARKVDAMATTLYDDMRRQEGAVGVLQQALGCVDAHKGYIKKDLEEKRIGEEDCKKALGRVDELMGILHNLRETCRINLVMIQGKHQQAGDVLSVCRTMFDEEKRTIQAVLEAMDKEQQDRAAGIDPDADIGKNGHPGLSLAESRRLQAVPDPPAEAEVAQSAPAAAEDEA